MTSDTPRTDAFVGEPSEWSPATMKDWPAFARQLERELAAKSLILNRYREALQRIAAADYRGNRPSECDIAQEAMRGH